MFIRFVIGHDGEHHRRVTGIIRAGWSLCESSCFERHEIHALEDIYDWLDQHLPCPPFQSRRLSKHSVCWFKTTAGEPIRKVWEIAAFLNEYSLPIRLLRSRNPGRILYEDQYQVVVEQWRRI